MDWTHRLFNRAGAQDPTHPTVLPRPRPTFFQAGSASGSASPTSQPDLVGLQSAGLIRGMEKVLRHGQTASSYCTVHGNPLSFLNQNDPECSQVKYAVKPSARHAAIGPCATRVRTGRSWLLIERASALFAHAALPFT